MADFDHLFYVCVSLFFSSISGIRMPYEVIL